MDTIATKPIEKRGRGGEARSARQIRRAGLETRRALGPLTLRDTLADLADLYARSARREEAERLYLRSQAVVRQILSEDPEQRDARQHLAAIRLGLGRLYLAMGAESRATESLERALTLIESVSTGSDEVALLHIRALALLHLGRVDEAKPLAERLLAIGWRHPDFVALLDHFGMAASPG